MSKNLPLIQNNKNIKIYNLFFVLTQQSLCHFTNPNILSFDLPLQTSIYLQYFIILIIYYFYQNQTMNNNFSHTNLNKKKIEISKQRNNGNTASKQQINLQLITDHFQSKDFHFRRYPFHAYHNQWNSLLKTTLSCKIEQAQLQKLINITHPNLINIRKIIRGHPKQPNNPILQDYFTFYYENVVYSLRRIASMTESSPLMMKSIQAINFKNIIEDLTQYLLDNDINHKISLDDIGINDSLQIKIYLSPYIACSIDKQQITHGDIYKNNQNLINWWKTTFSVGETKQQVLEIQQRYSFCGAEIKFSGNNRRDSSSNNKHTNIQHYGQDKYRPLSFSIDRHYQPLTSSIQRNIESKSRDKAQQLKNSQRTLASNTNPLQKAKIRKIHEQIQKIKKRVYKTSFDYRFRKQSDDIIHGNKNLLNKLSNQKQIFQSAKFQSNNHHQIPYQQIKNCNYEPIQQNINCINIYNQSPPKNKILKPVASYNFIPLAKKKHQLNHNSHGNIEVLDDRSNTNSQSNDSFHIQENISPTFYRHTLQPKEARPLIIFKGTNKTNNTTSNQIKVTNKNITQSAGPLQFKNIINKVIKPHFVSKKSNIYEDPQEDQSEHSLLVQETAKDNHQQQKLNKKDEMQYQGKLIKQNIQGLQLKTVCKKKRIQYQKIDQSTNSLQKDKNGSSTLFNKYKKMQVLNLRIKEVLLKSKNAIQLLNQGKSTSNLDRRCLSPQLPNYIKYKE